MLLERDKLTSGTTWHAAGLMVTYGSMSETSTSMRKYTKDLYARVLEEETGLSTGFKPCGFIEVGMIMPQPCAVQSESSLRVRLRITRCAEAILP